MANEPNVANLIRSVNEFSSERKLDAILWASDRLYDWALKSDNPLFIQKCLSALRLLNLQALMCRSVDNFLKNEL
jgi:hypothetical protein